MLTRPVGGSIGRPTGAITWRSVAREEAHRPWAGALGATAVSMAMFGTGVAAADDYAGQTYADASSALSDAKLTGVIATRVGYALPDDQCVVTRSQKAPWIKGDDFAPVTDTVLLYLNCNATVASATTPGNSAGSPEGRAALAAANAAAAPRPVDCCREPEPAQALVARHPAEQHVVASGAAGG